MLHLELPHVNLLSKIDLIQQYGKLQFNLDFYTEVWLLYASQLPLSLHIIVVVMFRSKSRAKKVLPEVAVVMAFTWELKLLVCGPCCHLLACLAAHTLEMGAVQVQDLSYLVHAMGQDAFSKRYRKLSQGLCEVSLGSLGVR